MNLKQADSQYIANTYGRFDALLDSGEGAVYCDKLGKRYIDMGSGIGVTTFGSNDPAWTQAVIDQLHKLSHVSNLYYTEPQIRLAQLLCEKTGMKKVFFANSGAEANEGALKIARKYGNDKSGGTRNVIITLENSFHGRTIATLAATGQDKFHQHFGPFPDGFRYVPANDCDAMKEAFAHGDVCGLLMEMVQGEGGVNTLDADFVKCCEQLCRENDALLMVDEVQTGNGRTGKLYAYMHFGIEPDVVTTAKGLGGGLPIGAVMMGARCENVLGKGDHGSTFGGNPVCAAGAYSILSRIDDELLAGVNEKAAWIREQLTGVPGVTGISGLGLMIGISVEKPAAQIAADCLRDGLLVLTAKDKVRLLPPLNITKEQLQEGISILKKNL